MVRDTVIKFYTNKIKVLGINDKRLELDWHRGLITKQEFILLKSIYSDNFKLITAKYRS